MACMAGAGAARAQVGDPAAAGTAPPPEGAASAPAADLGEVAEATREAVRDTAHWLARSIDSWFGDLRFDDGGGVYDGRLSLSLLKREGETLDHRLRVDARWRLPNIERRAYLFVGRDDERDAISDRPSSVRDREGLRPGTAAREDSFFGGLGVTLRDLLDFRIGLRSRARVYAQVRMRGAFDVWDGGVLGLSQTVFWTRDDLLGTTSAASLEHQLSRRFTLRWLLSATATQRERQAEWTSVAGLWWTLPRQRTAALELLVHGKDDSGLGAAEIGTRVRWEQLVYRDWLFGELLVGHYHLRYEVGAPRVQAWALGAGLRLHF